MNDFPQPLLAAGLLAAACGVAQAAAPSLPRASEMAEAILASRPAPLTEIAVERWFDVTEFGAAPDDDGDDLPGVRRALEAAQASGRPAGVRFPNGRYHLDLPADEKLSCLHLTDARDLVIDGGGSELVLRHPRSAFLRLTRCENIIVENLVIDYDPLPFTQGFVRAVHPARGQFDVEIQPGFLPPDAPHLNRQATGFLMDAGDPRRLKTDAENYFRCQVPERLESGLFRFTLRQPAEVRDFAVGDPFTWHGRLNAPVVMASWCVQVTCRNITIYSGPGANYIGTRGESLNILSCRTLIREGRWKSTNADGVHCQSMRVGPWIEDCTFEGMSDDGVNVYTLSYAVSPADDAGWISHPMFVSPLIREGDAMMLFNPRDGVLHDGFTVRAFDEAGKRLRLDPPLPADAQLDGSKLGDALYNQELNGRYTVIRNNRFQNIRGRGILLKAHHTLIEGNLFDHVSNQAIILHNNQDVPEGLLNRGVVIRGNVIRNGGTDANFTRPEGAAGISVLFGTGVGTVAQDRGHRQIAIEENRFVQWRRTGIAVYGAQGVTIRRNTLVNTASHRATRDADAPIRLRNVADVDVSGNTAEDTRDLADAVVVGPDCVRVQTRDNTLTRVQE